MRPQLPQLPSRPRPLLIALAFIAFISLGLPDGVLGVAWPSIHRGFEIPLSRLGLLLVCGTCGYLVVSATSGPLARRLGVGLLLTLSTLIVCSGLCLYALSPVWWALLPAAVLCGLGSGGIDAGLNAYAAQHFSARIMSWLHACYGVGATTGPFIVTAVLVAELNWRWAYAVLAAILFALTILFLTSRRLWNDRSRTPASGEQAAADAPAAHASMAATLRRPIAWVHIFLFWAYCGIEFSSGAWLFTILTESRGWDRAAAGPLVGGFWGALTLGRFVFGQLAARFSREAILSAALTLMPIAIVGFWLGGLDGLSPVPAKALSTAAPLLLGFALAPIFPMLMSATPDRIGAEHAPNAVGLQTSAAALGISLLPWLAGLLAKHFGLEIIPPFTLVLATAVIILECLARRAAHAR